MPIATGCTECVQNSHHDLQYHSSHTSVLAVSHSQGGNLDPSGLNDNLPVYTPPELRTGQPAGLGSQGSAEHPTSQGCAGGLSPRDSDAAAPPHTPTRAALAALESRPRRQAACPAHSPCRYHCWSPTLAHSHSAKPESLAFLR